MCYNRLMDNGQILDNGQITTNGQTMPPIQSAGPTPTYQSASGQPMVQQVKIEPKKDASGLFKLIAIIILSLVSVTFLGLFIWMAAQYNEIRANVDTITEQEVAKAKDEQKTASEEKCEKEKNEPYRVFRGPDDYGSLSFSYPKRWSAYVESDASNGGDYKAYFNPDVIEPINKTNINALRLQILNKNFDEVTATYQKEIDKKDSRLSVRSVVVNEVNANLYTGVIPGTEFEGFILVFKIRDKTAIMQTDSILFENDFNDIIETIEFNA